MKNRNQYTSAQKSAIMHEEGPAAVFAGPGSGKTFVLTEHIFYLIKSLHIKPQHILVITFTKSAAIHMEERFQQKMKENSSVVFKTFHAFFYQVLSKSKSHASKKILSKKEKDNILKMISFELFSSNESYDDTIEEITQCISRRNEEITWTEKEKKIISIYEEEKKKLHKMDFLDLVYFCYDILLEDESLLKQIRDNYRYILIDEFQDITPMQYKIINLLMKDTKNIFVVGDEDQSIYRFCGSNPNSMQKFLLDYSSAAVYVLSENFRSHKKIIQTSNQLICHNVSRFKKTVIPVSKKEGIVQSKSFQNQKEEIKYILDKIDLYAKEEKNKEKRKEKKSVAIILRTKTYMNYVAYEFYKKEIRLESKYNCSKFYANQRIKDILDYLLFAKEGFLREHLLGILNKPMRYIRTNIFRSTIVDFDEIMIHMENDGKFKDSILKLKREMDLISKMSISGAIHYIRKGIGYDDYLELEANEKYEEFLNWSKELDFLEEEAKRFSSLREFQDYILNVEAYSKQRKEKRMKYDSLLKVEMTTMHAAKGLEFDAVFIMDVNEGNIPHKKAFSDEEIEEERRLLYVALTRAREEVYILYIKEDNKNRHKESRYVKECIVEN